MDTQFITDKKGKKIAVIIGIDEYNKLMQQVEELEDIRSFDEEWPQAEKDLKKGKLKTLEQVKDELAGQ